MNHIIRFLLAISGLAARSTRFLVCVGDSYCAAWPGILEVSVTYRTVVSLVRSPVYGLPFAQALQFRSDGLRARLVVRGIPRSGARPSSRVQSHYLGRAGGRRLLRYIRRARAARLAGTPGRIILDWREMLSERSMV